MKKIIVGAVAALATLVAGCSCSPQNNGYQQPYNQGYAQQAPVQQPVVVRDNDSHMDAVLAGAAGLAAGKYLSDRSNRKTYTRRYYRPREVYVSRPARSTFSSYSSRRSSGYGSYRSRRR